MSQAVNNVLVVGGGTAGWLTAAKLAVELNSRAPDAVQVTLIESPSVATIGVGEGTWPTMRKTLMSLGIDESEFMRECCAAFKQGSKFVNWKHQPVDGVSNHYYNHFTSLVNPEEFNLAPYWHLGHADEGLNYAEVVSTQGTVCEHGLAPKKITTPQYDGLQSYAYHLDAVKFANLLKRHATEKLGVKYLCGHVKQVHQDEEGYITSLDTKEHGVLEAELFVDCTGFAAVLIGKTLGVPFHGIGDQLFVDHAVAIQVPYEDENAPVACQTISTAHANGWTWDIGLSSRRGTGFVYSSRYTDHDSAEQTLRDHLGACADQLEARRIKMNIGYREKFWHKNCVAVGLSAAFIEPLEASAIFLVEAAANMIADQFPRSRGAMLKVEKKFNESFRYRWDKSIEFIKLHYFLSGRSDSDFWLDNRKLETVPTALLDKLEHWKEHPPSRYDFANSYEPFALETYQYILYGMNFPMSLEANRASFHKIDRAKQHFAQVKQLSEMTVGALPTHRELLNTLQTYSFQKN